AGCGDELLDPSQPRRPARSASRGFHYQFTKSSSIRAARASVRLEPWRFRLGENTYRRNMRATRAERLCVARSCPPRPWGNGLASRRVGTSASTGSSWPSTGLPLLLPNGGFGKSSGYLGPNFTFTTLTSDSDGDGIPEGLANCPTISNPDQADRDLDR